MDKLASLFYKSFFQLDLLGKVVPAAIFIFSLLLLNSKLRDSAYCLVRAEIKGGFLGSAGFSVFGALLLFGILWIIGFGIQMTGEFPKILAAYPNPRDSDSEKYFWVRKAWFSEVEIKEEQTQSGQPSPGSSGQRITDKDIQGRERFVVIKEACGNTALAIFLALALALVAGLLEVLCYKLGFEYKLEVIIPLMLFGAIQLYSHQVHRERQACQEIAVLERVGKNSDEIEKMKKNSRCFPGYK